MYESNYHEFKLEEYQSFPHLYLNLIMEWMGGRHDEKQVGRLPRDPNHFVVSDPIFQLKKYFPDIYNAMHAVALETTDVRGLFLHEKVISVLERNFAALELINSHMAPILYTNQCNIGVFHG
jgi:hypothetical protein